jgi:hypothetical protein
MAFPNGFTIPGVPTALYTTPKGGFAGVATPATGSVTAELKGTPSEAFGFTSDFHIQQNSRALKSDTRFGVKETPLLGVGIPPNNLGLKPWLVPVAFAPPQVVPVPYFESNVGVNFGKFLRGNYSVKGPFKIP